MGLVLMSTCVTDKTVWPAYGEAAMLGSLFIVEAFSEMGWEVGEVVPDTEDPKWPQKTNNSIKQSQ